MTQTSELSRDPMFAMSADGSLVRAVQIFIISHDVVVFVPTVFPKKKNTKKNGTTQARLTVNMTRPIKSDC